ncbi:MAG TPA: GDSL-type esterase/lipase family protein [Acidobacteriaceae bacterium]|nr:GDSL-type esterase/lipase family protein [Acidobacteriaceae bacterium]
MRIAGVLAVLLEGALCLSGCTNGVQTASTQMPSQWVVAWGASPENAQASTTDPGGQEQSFRFFFYPTVSGTQERVHLSNLYATGPITIGAARLALAASTNGATGDAIDTAHDTALTFNGSSSVTLAAGQEIVSDPVNITYSFGAKMAVSLYVKGTFGPLTQHDSEFNTSFQTAPGAGDATGDAAGEAYTQTNTEWFVVTGVDVYGPYQGTVALYGSSSVDGHASNYGNTNAYPVANVPVVGQDNDRPSDWLARQLAAAGYNLGVLNAGAIGDPAGEDARTATGFVGAGVDRMQHDVLQQAAVKAVVIYFGGIDLRGDCLPATNVEASLTNMVSQAYAAGVRVILATLPPSEYCTTSAPQPSSTDPFAGDINDPPENSGSTQRRALNSWIRTSGAALPGVVAIADFDQALLYPAHPDFMQPSLNSGDNFHPNGAGYGVQSSAIPLGSLLGQ